jgi:hypothetical protein
VTPPPGSGSIASASALAAASENVQHGPVVQTPDENFEEVTSIVSAHLKVFHTNLLIGAAAPSTTLGQLHKTGVPRSVSLGTSVRQDAGLLAWLSARSAEQFDDHSELAVDNVDPSADWTDRYREPADSFFDDLCAPLMRSRTESLVAVG